MDQCLQQSWDQFRLFAVQSPKDLKYSIVDDVGSDPVESFCAFIGACGESFTMLVLSVTADIQLYNGVE